MLASHTRLVGVRGSAIPAANTNATASVVVLVTALVAALVVVGGAACGDRRVADDDLGALVVSRAPAAIDIDVQKAATDVDELRRALAVGHNAVSKVIGAHRVSATSSVKVATGGSVVTDLSDKTIIDIDGEGNFAATADNNLDYGRHAIHVDGVLYLRPRYGKYHRRAPATDDEPDRIRNEMFGAASAYFDLLYAGIELSDRGDTTFAGRPARVVDLKKAPTQVERDAETLAHKTWRNTIDVSAASGTLTLDSEHGFVLAAELAGTLTFVKEGKTHSMQITATHTIDPTAALSIEAPAADQFVSAPTMRTEVDEQRVLLGPRKKQNEPKGSK